MIWWCVEHRCAGDHKLYCNLIEMAEMGLPKPCRMVEALLIVKENGEWPEKARNAVSDAIGSLVAADWAIDALASVGNGL